MNDRHSRDSVERANEPSASSAKSRTAVTNVVTHTQREQAQSSKESASRQCEHGDRLRCCWLLLLFFCSLCCVLRLSTIDEHGLRRLHVARLERLVRLESRIQHIDGATEHEQKKRQGNSSDRGRGRSRGGRGSSQQSKGSANALDSTRATQLALTRSTQMQLEESEWRVECAHESAW